MLFKHEGLETIGVWILAPRRHFEKQLNERFNHIKPVPHHGDETQHVDTNGGVGVDQVTLECHECFEKVRHGSKLVTVVHGIR